MVEMLLDAEADVNLRASPLSGATALQLAAINGYMNIARTLIDKGADVNAPGARHSGRTALQGAAEHGRLDMAELLLRSGVETDGLYRGGFVAAVALAKRERHWAMERMLKDRCGWSPVDQSNIALLVSRSGWWDFYGTHDFVAFSLDHLDAPANLQFGLNVCESDSTAESVVSSPYHLEASGGAEADDETCRSIHSERQCGRPNVALRECNDDTVEMPELLGRTAAGNGIGNTFDCQQGQVELGMANGLLTMDATELPGSPTRFKDTATANAGPRGMEWEVYEAGHDAGMEAWAQNSFAEDGIWAEAAPYMDNGFWMGGPL